MSAYVRKMLILIISSLFILTGCNNNHQIIDTTYKYDTAIIKLANDDVIIVDVKSWKDYEGEQLQITANDGTVYLTNSFRCDLIGYQN